MTHELKILPKWYADVESGKKNFEIRVNDRDYKVGDTLVLQEYDKGNYTGREITRKIQYIYQGNGAYGLSEEYCVLGLKQEPCGDAISRQSAIFLADDLKQDLPDDEHIADMVMAHNEGILEYQTQLSLLSPVTPQPKIGQYEKHIDHTDCIWYGSDSGCPVTCSQYRDGWNDAMEYIFKGGKGYQPYRREENDRDNRKAF